MEEKKMIDAPLSSLMDSTASPKVKTMKGKRVGAHFLVHNTSGIKGRARALIWD
jgi:N-acetyl-anhydromuramyl-L-alanine amidase AmpD